MAAKRNNFTPNMGILISFMLHKSIEKARETLKINTKRKIQTNERKKEDAKRLKSRCLSMYDRE